MPDWHLSLKRWLDHLVSTRFLQQASTHGRFVSCAGSQTYLEGELNQADTIFLHGLPWNGESGRPLSEAMGGAVVRPDLPGMGRSSACEGPMDEWLAALLASRSRPIRIVAHSFATGIALRYARRWPEQVRELVLVSPFFLQAPAPRWMRCPYVTSRLLRIGDVHAMTGRLLGEEAGMAKSAVASAHSHLRQRDVARTVAESLSLASRSTERAALIEVLREVEVPCCVIHGVNDPVSLGDLTGPAFSIEGGHNVHLQKPDQVAQVIQAWRSAKPMAHSRATHSG